MPLLDGFAAVEEPRWLALKKRGAGLASPKGPGREGNPEGHDYTSAHIDRGARIGKYLGAKKSFLRTSGHCFRAPFSLPANQA
jgi:hypothetical protein